MISNKKNVMKFEKKLKIIYIYIKKNKLIVNLYVMKNI